MAIDFSAVNAAYQAANRITTRSNQQDTAGARQIQGGNHGRMPHVTSYYADRAAADPS